jgi:hypothetical protein
MIRGGLFFFRDLTAFSFRRFRSMRVPDPKRPGSGGARLGRLGFDSGIIVEHSLKEKLFLYFPSSWKQRAISRRRWPQKAHGSRWRSRRGSFR